MRYQFRGKSRELHGVSLISFDGEGKVVSQEDFWDAAIGVYSEFPLMGAAIKAIRKLVRVRPK